MNINTFTVKIISSSPMAWYVGYIGKKFSVFEKKEMLLDDDNPGSGNSGERTVLIPDYMFTDDNEKIPISKIPGRGETCAGGGFHCVGSRFIRTEDVIVIEDENQKEKSFIL